MAVEFAMVAPPLLLLLLSIIDLGMLLMTQTMLDAAARDAGRLIRTGQLSGVSSPITTFQNQMCNDLTPIMSTASCQSNILIEVQVFSNFGSVSFTPCTYNANATGTGTVCTFTPGTGSQIVGVRTTYNRPFLLGWVGACLSGGSCWTGLGTTGGSNPGTGKVALVTTVIFQNEPFS